MNLVLDSDKIIIIPHGVLTQYASFIPKLNMHANGNSMEMPVRGKFLVVFEFYSNDAWMLFWKQVQ